MKGHIIRAMNKLDPKTRAQIIHLLCEGNSIRAIVRLTGASKNTVTKLLVDVGHACADYQHRTLRNLTCNKIQVDEIWAFIYAKNDNVQTAKRPPQSAGDVWTWTAICADTKLLVSWLVGNRDTDNAITFMDDLKSRLANRVQLTSDGHRPYLEAVDNAFGDQVDYAMLQKIYGADPAVEKRYSPAKCIGAERRIVKGAPDPAHVSTSYVERHNLTMRMSLRRFTRLTNAFSKKIENHACAIALHSMFYNFVRIHQTLRVTPAMAAGVTGKLWEVADIVKVLENFEAAQRVEAPTVFQIIKLDIGDGFYVSVKFPSGESDALYSFETAGHAQDWIERESRAWLRSRQA